MSDTPRADLDLHWIEAHGLRMNHQYVSYALAQALERELNEARELLSYVLYDAAKKGLVERYTISHIKDYLKKGKERNERHTND